MNPELSVVRDLENRGFECRRFSKKELRASKTPDRKVFTNGQFGFFLEIKEIAESAWASGASPDPVFNRLTNDIHTAVQQFDAVNPDHEWPNVLALVNNDVMCGSLDLIGVVTGHLLLEGGGTAAIYMNYSEGRIRDEKRRVDLYLWYDRRKADQMFFNMFDLRHLASVAKLFGIDPEAISMVSA